MYIEFLNTEKRVCVFHKEKRFIESIYVGNDAIHFSFSVVFQRAEMNFIDKFRSEKFWRNM